MNWVAVLKEMKEREWGTKGCEPGVELAAAASEHGPPA